MTRTLRTWTLCAAALLAAGAKTASAGVDDPALSAADQQIGAEVAAQVSASKARRRRRVPPPPVERLEMPGLTNLAHVETGVYRGGRPLLDQGGMESLRKLGIKTIVNLQGGDLTSPKMSQIPDWSKTILKSEPGESPNLIAAEIAEANSAGILDVNIPLDSLAPITPDEAAALERILGMLAASTPENPIYVHCEHGKDRTGLVLALYRMRVDHWSRAKASAEMTEMGHTGYLDRLFTGNMDLKHVLPLYPALALPPAAPLNP